MIWSIMHNNGFWENKSAGWIAAEEFKIDKEMRYILKHNTTFLKDGGDMGIYNNVSCQSNRFARS